MTNGAQRSPGGSPFQDHGGNYRPLAGFRSWVDQNCVRPAAGAAVRLLGPAQFRSPPLAAGRPHGAARRGPMELFQALAGDTKDGLSDRARCPPRGSGSPIGFVRVRRRPRHNAAHLTGSPRHHPRHRGENALRITIVGSGCVSASWASSFHCASTSPIWLRRKMASN
jgi:hypothetical protein